MIPPRKNPKITKKRVKRVKIEKRTFKASGKERGFMEKGIFVEMLRECGRLQVGEVIEVFRGAGFEEASLEVRILFTLHGGLGKDKFMFNNVESTSEALADALQRRYDGEPLAYINGHQYFYLEKYTVTPDVLIPRKETEHLVEYAVKNLPEGGRFLDLCTGSGCVAISTLKHTKNTTAIALDISEGAILVAEENRRQNLGDEAYRLDIICADALAYNFDEQFDAILSNPPYIAENAYETLQIEVKREPKIALVGGGTDGGDFYRTLTSKYKSNLKKDGFIAYEIGYDQGELLRQIAEAEGMECQIIKDYSQNDRVAVLRFK